jgi:GDP-L-fucose synthase
MKVAVLGANGFVGSSIVNYLSKKYEVVPIKRDTIDLLNMVKVTHYLKDQMFDVVINAAAVMTDNNALHDTRNNLGLFMNFYNNSELFGKFINLGSGAEFDRTLDINESPEDLIFNRLPEDSYGFGQNIKSRLCHDKQNFFTLRLFNCFGPGEGSTRIFPKFISKQNEEVFEIQNNRYFDYFSISDLLKVIEHVILEDCVTKDINCVYSEKYKISEVLGMFCSANRLRPNFKVVSENSNNYTGRSLNLESLNIDLEGLKKGISNYA